MPARSPAVFSWRQPVGPAVVSGIFIAMIVAPLTFIILFAVLPPFWGGESRGILAEAHYAWSITINVTRNLIIVTTREVLPLIPARWQTGNWVVLLREHGVWHDFLIRISATVAATAWVAILVAARTYRRTGRIQGFEWVAGPRLIEGWNAARQANAAIARESPLSKDGIRLAYGLLLSRTREVLSFAFIGGQGSGKTTTLKFLLHQLIDRKKMKIILLDQKGDLTETWPASDVILFAPHDNRSRAWDIGADVTGDIAAQEFAATLVPTEGAETVWPHTGGTSDYRSGCNRTTAPPRRGLGFCGAAGCPSVVTEWFAGNR